MAFRLHRAFFQERFPVIASWIATLSDPSAAIDFEVLKDNHRAVMQRRDAEPFNDPINVDALPVCGGLMIASAAFLNQK
jgi:hypothetical protein